MLTPEQNPGEAQAPPAALPAHLGAKAEAYADGIVGSAWLWVSQAHVCRVRGRLIGSSPKRVRTVSDVDIIPTFGAGTLLVAGRTQRGREDVPAFLTPATSDPLGRRPPLPLPQARPSRAARPSLP